MPPPTAATSESLACGAHFLRGLLQRLVSLAAVFWMSRNAPQAFRDIQKTAARETIQSHAIQSLWCTSG